MLKLTPQQLLLKKYQKEPIEFFKAAWPGIIIWEKLEEVLKALVNNRRVVVPSGHGVGKTWLEARIAIWFLYCFPPAKVITTAPTWPQVELLLWSELKHALEISVIPFGGRILQTEIKIRDDWFAVGFSTRGKAAERQYGTPKFQGFHAPNLLVLLDEGPGVEHEIWVSVDSLIVSENNKVLAMGNPTSPSGDFYEACKSPLWRKVQISSYDHPNVKLDQIVVPGAVTREWIEERKLDWGEDSPLWQAKVLGQFPTEGEDTLIPLAWVEACVGLELSREGMRKLGVDVARFGGDSTVFTEVEGQVVLPQEAYNKKDTNFTTGIIESKHREKQFDAIGVDDGSMGGGVVDNLSNDGIDVEPFVFGSSAIEDGRFENQKAEIFWNLRCDIRDKKISLPDDKELINQVCSLKYGYTRKGKIKIESKDEMKKRGLKSPDKADSLAIAWSAGRELVSPTVTIMGLDD